VNVNEPSNQENDVHGSEHETLINFSIHIRFSCHWRRTSERKF